jgi:hypothetical protein
MVTVISMNARIYCDAVEQISSRDESIELSRARQVLRILRWVYQFS